ncbi:hypothetical protein ABH029_17680, partial [Bacteroides thetaiotaomicron]
MKNKSKILPVLFGFFIMGFCDLVGVSVTYAKDYFSWSETQAGFLPSMVFIWFLLISIPISIWMDKKGRKTIDECPHAAKLAKFKPPRCPKVVFWNTL